GSNNAIRPRPMRPRGLGHVAYCLVSSLGSAITNSKRGKRLMGATLRNSVRSSIRARANCALKLDKLAGAVAVALALPTIVVLQPAHAQQPAAQPEEIVITGSRIVRRDYEANSPIQTLDASAFEQQSSIAIEDTLNQLPQFVPAATGLTQVAD